MLCNGNNIPLPFLFIHLNFFVSLFIMGVSMCAKAGGRSLHHVASVDVKSAC